MLAPSLFPSAVERWEALVDARARQMDRAYAQLGRTSHDFWDRRARGFHRATKDSVASEVLFQRVSRRLRKQDTLLDVGAGTGRFTLALAPFAQEVFAVEPNEAMLGFLQRGMAEKGLKNITCIQSSWEEAPGDLQADYVLCSHVLYPIRAIVPFVEKLREATRQACYLVLRGTQLEEATAPLWQHFHGEPRYLQPGYIHALDVLFELGIYANVEIVHTSTSLRYPSRAVAEEELLEQLILPDTPETRKELRTLLNSWLVEEQDGTLRPPQNEIVSAILEFEASDAV